MGEGYHSNRCMKLFDKLGFKVDSTAMPGRARNDERKFDWTGTPAHPYHPSKEDYRVPGKDPLGILEVPMSMIQLQTSYDAVPLPRYLDLSFNNDLMRDGISELVASEDLIVSITHPFELVPGPKKHPLISFDVREAVRNIEFIIRCCEKASRPIRFISLSEVQG
jgi:hypothetical protein